jgi:hypothetical protein
VLDGFNGLRHDAIVSGDDEDHNVGSLGAAGAHHGEGFVTRRIQEDYPTSFAWVFRVRYLYAVSTDVLRNATCFSGGYIGGANTVK